MSKYSLHNVAWKEGKYFVAQCLNVDVSSFGDTRKEALKNLDEALALYFCIVDGVSSSNRLSYV